MGAMKTVVLYSGGLGSFATACYLKDMGANCLLYFNDTKMEDPDLYRFLFQSQEYLKFDLLIDADGRDVWEVFEDERYVGNTRLDPCSRVLKRERSREFIFKNFEPEEIEIAIGIDWTEIHRYEKAKPKWLPYNLIAPLIDGLVDKDELVEKHLRLSGIKRPRLYDLGFSHNNCGGFCVKAGLGQFKKLWEQLPDRYKYHEEKELETYQKIGSCRPFLRKTINGELTYITLREYREQYLEPSKVEREESLDFGGCGCAI